MPTQQGAPGGADCNEPDGTREEVGGTAGSGKKPRLTIEDEIPTRWMEGDGKATGKGWSRRRNGEEAETGKERGRDGEQGFALEREGG